jgi:large subunit ribosomal protein L35
MPKMKTQRGAMKRFKLTAKKKVKREKAYGSHILTKKSSKRKRGLGQPAYVSTADIKHVKRMLLT